MKVSSGSGRSLAPTTANSQMNVGQEAGAIDAKPLSGREVDYYKKTGQDSQSLIPLLNDRNFSDFWKESDISASQGTVEHRLMKSVDTKLLWHIKTPGKESRSVKVRRFFQKVLHYITGKTYKATFYDEPKVLVQRECLAANVYKTVVGLGDEYETGYSYNEGSQRHSIASKDLGDFRKVEEVFGEDVSSLKGSFMKGEDPMANLVMRRFFLGDQDYLKFENYMLKTVNDEANVASRLVAIDFGMCFYNHFNLPEECSFDAFYKKLTTPSNLHKFQYHNKKTLLPLVKEMDIQKAKTIARDTLLKISVLTDEDLVGLSGHIHDESERSALLTILRSKRQQASNILKDIPKGNQ